MAKYTITISSLVSSGYQVFDSSWSTFEEEHKAMLCDKILRHYWFNEIGAETPDRFKHYLNTHLAEIMPYYNMLYETAANDLLPLYNLWIETTTDGKEFQKTQDISSGRNDKSSAQIMLSSLKSMSDGKSSSKTTGTVSDTKKWDETDIIDRTEKEHDTINYSEKTSENEKGTKDFTRDSSSTGHEDKDSKGDKETKLVQHQDTNGTRNAAHTEWSSDTPQGSVVNNQFAIDNNYLTNYMHSTDTEQTTGSMDETDTTNETHSDTITTDTTGKENTTEKTQESKDIVGSKKADTVTDISKTGKDVIDKAGKEDRSHLSSGESDGRQSSKSTEFSESTTDNRSVDTMAQSSEATANKTNKATTVTRGNNNITRSELIRKYRENYLNIDLEIIKALANNFMGVF